MINNDDFIISAISDDGKINAYIAVLKNTAGMIQKMQNLNMISTSILSRALTASALLSGSLKNKNDILSLKWNCTGGVQSIFAEADFEGNIRGYIEVPDLNFIEGSLENTHLKAEPYIGFGELVVSRKTFDNRPYYNSVTPIETGEIAEDIAIYLKQSLQIKSDITISISINDKNEIKACGGILLMAMPEINDNEAVQLDEAFNKIGSFTEKLKNNTNNIDNVIDDILKKLNLKMLSKKKLRFFCSCNESKILNALKNLKKDDFLSFIADDGMIKATCQSCGKNYSFVPNEVKEFNESSNKPN